MLLCCVYIPDKQAADANAAAWAAYYSQYYQGQGGGPQGGQQQGPPGGQPPPQGQPPQGQAPPQQPAPQQQQQQQQQPGESQGSGLPETSNYGIRPTLDAYQLETRWSCWPLQMRGHFTGIHYIFSPWFDKKFHHD